jgi:di/tricarboxylate transporter
MDGASIQISIVLVLTAVVLIAFVRETFSPDVVAMLAFGLLLAAGILTSKEALSVFSNAGPIAVGAMFVLSAALERTGVVERVGRLTRHAAGYNPTLALAGLMLIVMGLSAFMNNTPVVVILTPVVIALARMLKLAPSRLLIPLSYAAIFGGTTTLIGTSTNLIVNGVATQHGLPPISMFEITLPGMVIGLGGIAYLALFGRWLLPDRAPNVVEPLGRRFVTEFLIPTESPFVGKTLEEARLTGDRGVTVIDVIRHGNSYRSQLQELMLEAGDRLVVSSTAADVMGLHESGSLLFGARDQHYVEALDTQPTVMMEGVVGPQSRLIGFRISDLNFRRFFGVYILAIYRQGHELRQNFDDITLESGDTLLLQGPPDGLRRQFERRVLVNLTEPEELPYRRGKARIAVGAIVLVMTLAAFDALPIEALAIMAAAIVVATGCLTASEAYEAIHWRILMLIFGMLALGLVSMIFLFTSALTEVVSNNATAIILTPIAIGLAQELGVDPRPFMMAVLFAASATFATPIGYQTNTFVYGIGGYRFADFLRVGVPMNILAWLTASIVIPWYWPL